MTSLAQLIVERLRAAGRPDRVFVDGEWIGREHGIEGLEEYLETKASLGFNAQEQK